MAWTKFAVAVLSAQAWLRVQADFGPYVDVGTLSSPNYIVSATSTLVLGDYPPDNNAGSPISLWCGMAMSNNDLIQSIAGNDQCTCWDVFAFTLTDNGDSSIMGAQSDASPGAYVTMAYALDPSSGNYTQTVSVNGTVVSTLSTSNGATASGWGTAVECNDGNICGTIPAHSWINTQIVLAQADPNYGSTRGSADGATGGDMSTPDGGTTWDLSTIYIPEFSFGT